MDHDVCRCHCDMQRGQGPCITEAGCTQWRGMEVNEGKTGNMGSECQNVKMCTIRYIPCLRTLNRPVVLQFNYYFRNPS